MISFALLVSAFATIVLDQATKRLAMRRIAPGQSVALGRWVRLRRVESRSVLPRSARRVAREVVLGIGVLVLITLAAWRGILFAGPMAHVGLGAALGGAVSNLHDRVRRGRIVDFIDLGWWPTFNLADVAISVGVLFALIPG